MKTMGTIFAKRPSIAPYMVVSIDPKKGIKDKHSNIISLLLKKFNNCLALSDSASKLNAFLTALPNSQFAIAAIDAAKEATAHINKGL